MHIFISSLLCITSSVLRFYSPTFACFISRKERMYFDQNSAKDGEQHIFCTGGDNGKG